jgi:beta-lactamase superfamily II metal-dependent hydrolase
MATPASVEIRAYQVGFGDCFLVTFVYSKSDRRHVLIDFGTTELPKLGKDQKAADYMRGIAEHIKKVCKGKLTAVVATHRHADHISGFSTEGKGVTSGKVIADCKPDVVLQPWTEDPSAARDAKSATADTNRSPRSFVASLNAMHRLADYAWRIARNPPAAMSASAAKQLRFLGMDNIKNRSAVENLIAMGKRSGASAVWAHHGSSSGLAGKKLLDGVKVHVLGPPNLQQTDKIRKMRSSDPDEFWQLLGGARGLEKARFDAVDPGSAKAAGNGVPPEARWFRDRIARLSADQLLEIVRVLDDQMNNTSLILLFEVGKKKLLFPGDAQIENWSWALEDAPDHAKTRKLLAGVDFYKVGHHGSRNATPKTLLWENFAKRGKGAKRMKTALSTLKGKHGTPAKKTEVPRKTLLEALEKETTLVTTEGYKPAAGKDPCLLTTITV